MRPSCRHLASPVAIDGAHCAAAVVHSRFKRLYTVTMISKVAPLLLAAVVALADTAAVRAADPAPFDLAGPIIEVTVTRNGTTLPISQVPNLAAGDRLWIKADLPPSQSARYVMVAAFLRGATNPPPPNWFFPCQAWSRQCAQEGMEVTVP